MGNVTNRNAAAEAAPAPGIDYNMPVDKFVHEFESRISGHLHLDNSRREFVQETADTMHMLMNNQLQRNNGHRRLLLAQKGVGKTTLMVEIVKAAQPIADTVHQLVCVSITYDEHTTARLPSTHIGDALGCVFAHDSNTVSSIEAELSRQNKYLLLTVDEFQNVYDGAFALGGQQTIGQIRAIGGARGGRIHCIVSGNSSVLPQLCFGKLPDDKRSEYTNYNGIDMNCTKYSTRWIYPMLDASNLTQLMTIQQNGLTNQ
jgi:hypothetical protein